MSNNTVSKTLRISFALNSTYSVNSILYGLKQIPVIKKLIPESLYGNEGLKVFVSVIAVIWEIFKAFSGKFIYIFGMVFFPALLYNVKPWGDVYLHIIFLLTFIGMMLNTYIFNPNQSDYYAVVLMRMNAREYVIVKYGYALCKVIVGFLIFGCIFGGIAGVPLYINILIPFFVVGAKLTYSALSLVEYEKKGLVMVSNVLDKLKGVCVFVLLLAAYVLPAFGIWIPKMAILVCMLIVIAAGLFSTKKILTFQGYRIVYGRLLKELDTQLDKNQNVTLTNTRNVININKDDNAKRIEKKKGYEYLNALFISRHRKILWKPVKLVSIICVVLVLGSMAVIYFEPSMRKDAASVITGSLPVSLFWMYMINRGNSYTQALFMNCDHSLLTYPFYRKPKAILGLFAIRLREIVKMNVIPAAILGVGLSACLYMTGKCDSLLTYLLVTVTIIAESVFFSVHYLVIYYLLQPYNAGTEVKSGMYKLISGVTYFACYCMINVQMPAVKYGCIMTGFAVAYCIIGCVLVYKIAPRTFKIRA